ncbi:transmembrane protein 194, partial [Tanacetum coccineum]
IDVGNPRVHVTPVFMNGVSEFCGRVPVSGVSRLKLQHYASAYNVTLVPSVLMPKKWHSKIQVCFHGNSSVGLCQCEKDDWRSLQDGFWSSFMSPYERKYVDVKFGDKVTGSVTVGVDEVLAVVLILLFQARKLLPTGKKNTFYFGIMVSVLGAGSFVIDYFSKVINSLLLNFGISQEIQNPGTLKLEYANYDDTGIDVGNPRVHVTPVFMNGVFEFCSRVPVSVISIEASAYASCVKCHFGSIRIDAPSKWHSQNSSLFHGNSSVGLCQCEKMNWLRSLQDGFEFFYCHLTRGNNVDVNLAIRLQVLSTVGVMKTYKNNQEIHEKLLWPFVNIHQGRQTRCRVSIDELQRCTPSMPKCLLFWYIGDSESDSHLNRNKLSKKFMNLMK